MAVVWEDERHSKRPKEQRACKTVPLVRDEPAQGKRGALLASKGKRVKDRSYDVRRDVDIAIGCFNGDNSRER